MQPRGLWSVLFQSVVICANNLTLSCPRITNAYATLHGLHRDLMHLLGVPHTFNEHHWCNSQIKWFYCCPFILLFCQIGLLWTSKESSNFFLTWLPTSALWGSLQQTEIFMSIICIRWNLDSVSSLPFFPFYFHHLWVCGWFFEDYFSATWSNWYQFMSTDWAVVHLSALIEQCFNCHPLTNY